MSAALELQAALVAALLAADGIAGVAEVFDGPPARAGFPYIAVEGGVATDWSSKTTRGREHRLAITVWDENGRSARLQALMAAAGAAIEGLSSELPGHRIASIVFLRERVARGASGPWAGIVEYRVRTVAD